MERKNGKKVYFYGVNGTRNREKHGTIKLIKILNVSHVRSQRNRCACKTRCMNVKDTRELRSMSENNSVAVHSFCLPLQRDSMMANGDASLGKYVAGSVVGAGADASLFVQNHAY